MSEVRPPSVRDIVGALGLRAWALRLLDPRTRRTAGAAPAATEASWELFLSAERCAAPLLAASSTAAIAVHDALRTAATFDAQRALAARRAAVEIGAAAAAAGIRLAVLKGAVECIEQGVTFFLTDLDLLAAPADFDAARRLLASLGYVADSDADVEALEACNINLRAPTGGVQLELHWTTNRDLSPLPAGIFDALVPLRRAPGLFALPPQTHAWHVLTHGVLDHPEQQGRIRDALVLGRALGRCDEPARANVAARAERHACAPALVRALGLAAALAGRAAATDDRFLGPVSVAYALRGSMSRALRGPLHREAAVAALLGVSTGAPGRAALESTMRLDDVSESTAARALGPLPEPARGLAGRAARIALYALHLAPVAPTLLRAATARAWATRVARRGRTSEPALDSHRPERPDA